MRAARGAAEAHLEVGLGELAGLEVEQRARRLGVVAEHVAHERGSSPSASQKAAKDAKMFGRQDPAPVDEQAA